MASDKERQRGAELDDAKRAIASRQEEQRPGAPTRRRPKEPLGVDGPSAHVVLSVDHDLDLVGPGPDDGL